jgi:uncharacterized protein with PIN domain
MSRIQKGYELQFRALLQKARARKLEQGVQWLLARAQELMTGTQMSPAEALTRVYVRLAARKPFQNSAGEAAPIRFLCDAGLGGLARWLRAAGQEAVWIAGIDDSVLLREAQRLSATILTTDSMLLERRLLRDGIIPAFWLPPTLVIQEQLNLVFCQFGLKVQEPRCMSCGGELRRVEKEVLRERIPPRTYRWLDEYFVCRRCAKLFWRGTHWQHITRELKRIEFTNKTEDSTKRKAG